MKKAIFGGTFDPVHNGHIHIAREALDSLNLDKLIFMPSGNPPHKTDRKVTDAQIRYEMVKMAAGSEERFEVSSFEIDQKRLSYTYKTMESVHAAEQDTEWYFISGADCLLDIEKWRHPERIFKHCKLAVFSRPGYTFQNILKQKAVIEEKYGIEIIILKTSVLDVSSTEIRNKIKNDEDVSYALNPAVYKLIKELGLYR
jgi:nicotinate-nucleotide adenylyltransferase